MLTTNLITLTEASRDKALRTRRTGRPPSTWTLLRWAKRGRIPVVRVGRALCTTREAVLLAMQEKGAA